MALKLSGFDQVSAWIIGIVAGGAVVGLILFVGKKADTAQETRKEERAHEAERLLSEANASSNENRAKAKSKHQDDTDVAPIATTAKPFVSSFAYSGASAPWRWSDIKDEWKLCGAGKKQSPVDLSGAKIDPKLKALKFNYQHGTTTLGFANQTIQGDVELGSWIDIDGDRYDLKKVTVHTPSEHRVNGLPFEMEVQFHHRELSGRTAVVAVLVTAGKSHPAFLRMANKLPRYEGETATLDRFVWTDILPTKRTYWQYEGSDTAPPCHEGVQWLVFTNTIDAATREIDSLAQLQKNNARPVQELGRRTLRRSNR
jgi:carbonic anhydrase